MQRQRPPIVTNKNKVKYKIGTRRKNQSLMSFNRFLSIALKIAQKTHIKRVMLR